MKKHQAFWLAALAMTILSFSATSQIEPTIRYLRQLVGDVRLATSPTTGDVLTYNGTVWTNLASSGAATSFTNTTVYGFEQYPIYTNVYQTFTNITLNPTNGIKQTINLSNNVLLAASGNVAGFSRDMDVTVYSSGSFSVYFPPLASGWNNYGTNTAGTPVGLTNGQTMKIAVNYDGTNVHYAPVPRNN